MRNGLIVIVLVVFLFAFKTKDKREGIIGEIADS
jgi:hypothetical protein